MRESITKTDLLLLINHGDDDVDVTVEVKVSEADGKLAQATFDVRSSSHPVPRIQPGPMAFSEKKTLSFRLEQGTVGVGCHSLSQ
jgi:hypothetical protein